MTVVQDTANSSPTVRLRIEGMHCAGCVSSVQGAIESQPNVESASVSLPTGRATVSGGDIDIDAVIDAIGQRGYDAERVDEQSPGGSSAIRSEIESRQQRNERQWLRRAIVGLGLWVPLEAMHWLSVALELGAWTHWAMFAGSTIVIAIAGWGFYRSAIRAAMHKTTNMDTLIAIGATTAYIYSAIRLISGLGAPLYFAEAAGLLGIVSLGHWFEARASARAGSAVRDLLELQPDDAELIDEDGRTRSLPTADITPGDRLLVRPGARVPVDGVVVDGASSLDESVVTGESMPVERTSGDQVVAGAVNTTGRLVIEAETSGRDTTVTRIADLVQEAQSSKAEIQRLADRISAIFVPAVISIAAITLLGWLLAGSLATGVISAVTVLIISCPCALGLATPMAVMVGTGAASREGILIKSAGALERIGRAKQIVFDKTGTLTLGEPAVDSVSTEDREFNENEVLRLAGSAESASEHPIARAIVQAAEGRGIQLASAEDFAALPGSGVEATVEGRRVRVERDEHATCRVVVDDKTVGLIEASDAIREDARSAISQLASQEITVTLLTGDREDVAHRIAEQLGIDARNVIADATPKRKADFVRDLGTDAVMVGDGLNDAAALASAGTGVALASGTNVAIESAEVVIPGEHVMAVPRLVRIARSTLTTIKQNLFFAFVYNAAAIPAAAFGLLGERGPLIAALAMGLSDITVIGNALRLRLRLRREARQAGRAGEAGT